MGTLGPYMECLHEVQKLHPDVHFVCAADDTAMNGPIPELMRAYETKTRLQRDFGVLEQMSKAAFITLEGDPSLCPAAIPGSPFHVHGRLRCFRAVGTYFGDPGAVADALTDLLKHKLAPLRLIDALKDSDDVQNVKQLCFHLLHRRYALTTQYIAQVTPPDLAMPALQWADGRLRQSFEDLTEADQSPPARRENAWLQATLPSDSFGGGDIASAAAFAGNIHAASVFACLSRLAVHSPAAAAVAPVIAAARAAAALHQGTPPLSGHRCPVATAAHAAAAAGPTFLATAIADYETTLAVRASVAATHARFAEDVCHRITGSKDGLFHPKRRLPCPFP